MISVLDAIVMFLFGAGVALFCVFAGCVIHMRWLDRKIMKPLPKAAPITQQIHAVKP
jgi:hypothetical protein